MPASPVELITKKRKGLEHDASEIETLISDFSSGALTDYQMAAWLMASFLNGLSDREMTALTVAMRDSGRVLTMKSVKAPKIDKHSTGGVGDKISIPLGPLVAVLGVAVPMISGRGLGHTGGTLDKLEAIHGYDTRLSATRFESVVREVGVSIIGQTAEMAPADKRIYALRDVTGTVESRPLIVASILSKKLAAGLDGLVLDVKVGRGAFMKEEKSALALARSLVAVASKLGTKTSALLTNMDVPLGDTIGNALEIEESIRILRGEGPEDTTELTLELGAEMLLAAGIATNRSAARSALRKVLGSGEGLERFAKMVRAHGGDAKIVLDTKHLPTAKLRKEVKATRSGYVASIDPLALANAALRLGAGRIRAEDPIDPAVGVVLRARLGERVTRGDTIAIVHTAKGKPNVEELVGSAFEFSRDAPPPPKLVRKRVGKAG